jgi:hypothetical protein
MPLNTAGHSVDFAQFLEAGTLTAGMFAQNFPRSQASNDGVTGATGLITGTAIALHAGDTVTKITFMVGATAGGTATNQWGGIYSSATIPLTLGQSTATATATMAANTVWTYTMATPIVIPSDGLYWAVSCVTAGTPPTFLGRLVAPVAAQSTALNTLFGNQGYAATATGNATTAPATMASLTNLVAQPWVLIQ